jgi:hypothetical protein
LLSLLINAIHQTPHHHLAAGQGMVIAPRALSMLGTMPSLFQ